MPFRVLIVDDSPTIRRLIRFRLQDDPRLEVVGEAADAIQARALIKALVPDVLTLDIEMPGMSGLQFLDRLMALRPMPVVMISSETRQGSEAALEALALGAVECLWKPRPGRILPAFENLPDVLCAAAMARLQPHRTVDFIDAVRPFQWNGKIVLIGASTGGVEALKKILSGFPKNCPPVLVTQHMPATFLASFAARLKNHILPDVALACDEELMEQGRVYLAPGGETHLTLSEESPLRCQVRAGERFCGHRPSVDVMFASAVPHANRVVAAVLTGMGRDGASALRLLRLAGARCLAQDRDSSVVYGMPRAASEGGGAEQILPLELIGQTLLDICSEGKLEREIAPVDSPRPTLGIHIV